VQGRFYVGAGGTCPIFTCCPQIQKLVENVGLYGVRIFLVSENGQNGLDDERADGARPPRIFGLDRPCGEGRIYPSPSVPPLPSFPHTPPSFPSRPFLSLPFSRVTEVKVPVVGSLGHYPRKFLKFRMHFCAFWRQICRSPVSTFMNNFCQQ